MPLLVSLFLTLPAGRRAKFAVLGVWLLVVVAAGSVAGKFEEAQKNEPVTFLPGDAESVRALEAVRGFPSGRQVPAVVAYRRSEGLTDADLARIRSDREGINADPPGGLAAAPPRISRDETTALLIVPLRAGSEQGVVDATKEIRDQVGEREGGLAVEVTGAAGFSTDAIEVFESIDGTLLIAAASLVFVLLILIYRSPIFWVIPLLSVAFAEVTSRGVGYGLTEAGVTVNGQSAGILVVLVFGAGTDYALLLVARYREELRRHADRHRAMRIALGRAGPAILASGITVIAALLCLSFAEVNGTEGLGPIGAIGIALAMIAMLTVLPSLLLIAGRGAFWPFVPRVGSVGADESRGRWRGVADAVGRRPRRVWVMATIVLAAMCLGLVALNSDLTTGNGFRDEVESVEGQDLTAKAFPAGTTAPATVVVREPSQLDAVREALADAPGVASVGRPERGPPGVRFELTLEPDPYSETGFELIPDLRRVAEQAGGPSTLIGGPTAEERDLRVSVARDNRLLIPLVLAVVLVILGVVLRSVVAPVVLTATVVLSFGAALGAGALVSEYVFDFPGIDPTLPLYAFIFLVPLGVDYNIFLMTRVREESRGHGTGEGMLRGLAVTGAVITAAGIVLAGTFGVLGVLPLVTLTQIGFVVAFGVLLDTFLVRSVLVPALVLELGPRTWWPSTLSRRPERPAPERSRGRVSEPAGESIR
jgi:putative drug exporter of the RND superfamily